MQKFMNITLLLCCGLLWNVNVSAQDAVAGVKKQDCKVVSACCASASTAMSTKSNACHSNKSSATSVEAGSQEDDNSSAVYAASNLEALYTASYVALSGNQPANCKPANCKPANCDPANCDPANCSPANCDPNNCPPACKRACPSKCGKAGAAKTGQKL